MENLTDILGRQPELPDWVYDGQIIATQGGTAEYDDAIMISAEKNLQMNAIWIQDWEGQARLPPQANSFSGTGSGTASFTRA
jgi:alpha-glucosidase